MIKNYDEFILENKFEKIVKDIFFITESDGKWINDRQYVWDFEPPEKDKNLIERTKDKLAEFISKLDKEQIRKYYIKLVNKLKGLPDKTRNAVYERMRTEREKEAKEIRAIGNQESEIIKATSDCIPI